MQSQPQLREECAMVDMKSSDCIRLETWSLMDKRAYSGLEYLQQTASWLYADHCSRINRFIPRIGAVNRLRKVERSRMHVESVVNNLSKEEASTDRRWLRLWHSHKGRDTISPRHRRLRVWSHQKDSLVMIAEPEIWPLLIEEEIGSWKGENLWRGTDLCCLAEGRLSVSYE